LARYILNSAVITTEGIYIYRLITLDEAKKWLQNGDFLSTIGYQETANVLSFLTGISIPVNRKLIRMEKNDEALVFRLTCRLSAPELKGQLSKEFILRNCEIGILKKILK